MTSSRGGTPVGKAALRSAFRTSAGAAARRERRPVVVRAWPLASVAAAFAPELLPLLLAVVRRRRAVFPALALLDDPATPCARLRCAPSAAARVNALPHSGQTNSSWLPSVLAVAASAI